MKKADEKWMDDALRRLSQRHATDKPLSWLEKAFLWFLILGSLAGAVGLLLSRAGLW